MDNYSLEDIPPFTPAEVSALGRSIAMDEQPRGFKVYAAINRVQAALAKEGISKDRQNQQQHYSFRGIDDVYNSISALLAENMLVILPRYLKREMIERKSNSGGALFNVVVEGNFQFVSAEDGSSHSVTTFGEAMDSADKATNKAMSAAYKYACLQAFCIPTEGDNDADATTHNVEPKSNGNGKPPTNPTPQTPQKFQQTEAHKKLWDTLFDFYGKNEEATQTALFNLTTYTSKSGQHVKGHRVLGEISEQVAQYAFAQFIKEHTSKEAK